MIGFLSALALLAASANPCGAPLPRGPEIPAPIVLSTDCGWFSLETDGRVTRLPRDWYATHKQPLPPQYTIRRTRAGRYLVVRAGRVVWRSTGLYFNEAGSFAFGPRAFAFDSYGQRGLFLTDLVGPERLLLHGRGHYPIGFSGKDLLVSGRRKITVISADGSVLRRFRYRPSTSFAFDEGMETLYFVTPGGMLSVARGPAVRPIRKVNVKGWIGLLGRRLLTFTGQRHVEVLRRDGSLVARAGWRGARRELDVDVDTSDDGKLFAFRVSKARPGVRRSTATVYVLRAGEGRARVIYRHRLDEMGCGTGAGLDWQGSSLLYVSRDGTGVPETAVLAPDGSSTRLTPLLRALPRITPTTPGNAFWANGFF